MARPSPEIDWQLAHHLFVRGELRSRSKGLPPETVYPSFAEIATRIGCSKQCVKQRADRDQWIAQRRAFLGQVEEKITLVTAESRARLIAEPLAIVDDYISKFANALEKGRVRLDTAADFDRMARLRSWLIERDTAKAEERTAISLEEMQSTHRAVRTAQEQAEADIALAGVLNASDDDLTPPDTESSGNSEQSDDPAGAVLDALDASSKE